MQFHQKVAGSWWLAAAPLLFAGAWATQGCQEGAGDASEPTGTSAAALVSGTPNLLDRVHALDALYRASTEVATLAPGADREPPQIGYQFSRRGVVRALHAPGMAIPIDDVVPGTTSPEVAARKFLAQWADLFGVRDASLELEFVRANTGATSEVFVRFAQRTPSGRSVFLHDVLVVLGPGLRVAGLTGLFLRDPPDGEAVVSADEAVRVATTQVGRADAVPRAPVLGVYDAEAFDAPLTPPRLAWQVDVDTNEPAIWSHYVDAATGDILLVYDRLDRDQKRETYWTNHTTTMPGTLIYRDNPFYQVPWQGTSQWVDHGNDAVQGYVHDRHSRDSWDNNLIGGTKHRISCTSDFGTAGSPGAWWEPAPNYRAKFGDDAACDDVVGHEVFHGVDEVEGNLGSTGQSGALGETFSDIFGEFTERYAAGSGPDWLQGTGAYCYPIRDMASPEAPSCGTCDTQAGHYLNYGRWIDAGQSEIHNNCGIPSKSGWLLGRDAAEGAVTFAGLTVTGIGEADAGRVWYDTLTNRMTSTSKFRDFREGIASAAASLFGVGENRYTQSLRSVDAIGIWSGDYWLTFDSNRRVAASRFTVGAEDRRYIIYKKAVDTNPNLYARYTTSCIYCGGAWSAATHLDYTGAGPAAVVFDNKLWVFYKYDLNNNLFYRTLDSAGSWAPKAQPPGAPTTDGDVAAAVFDGKLYVFFKVAGTTDLKYMTWSPAAGWGGPLPSGATSQVGPAVAAPLRSKLWLVYLNGADAGNLRYRTLTTAGGWSAESTPPRQYTSALTGSPAAYVFRDRLHVVGRTAANLVVFSGFCPSGGSCTYRADDWSQSVVLDMGGRTSPALWDEGLNHLYMFYRSTASDALWWNYKRSE